MHCVVEVPFTDTLDMLPERLACSNRLRKRQDFARAIDETTLCHAVAEAIEFDYIGREGSSERVLAVLHFLNGKARTELNVFRRVRHVHSIPFHERQDGIC